jgi:hypothetical protein
VNRRPSRFSTCPPCHVPEDSRSAQARKIGRKSLALKILPLSQMGSRLCGRSSLFSTIYRQAGGRGYTSIARGEVCIPGKKPCAVPEGTQVSLLAYPALKRWAKLFRPYGARVFSTSYPGLRFPPRFAQQRQPLSPLRGSESSPLHPGLTPRAHCAAAAVRLVPLNCERFAPPRGSFDGCDPVPEGRLYPNRNKRATMLAQAGGRRA